MARKPRTADLIAANPFPAQHANNEPHPLADRAALGRLLSGSMTDAELSARFPSDLAAVLKGTR